MEKTTISCVIPEYEFSKKDETPIAMINGVVVSYSPIDRLLEDCGFKYELTLQYDDCSCMDIFNDDDNNSAIVEYRPANLEHKLSEELKVAISVFIISRIEIYSNNSGETEVMNLEDVFGRYPECDFKKSLSRIIEKIKAEEKNAKYTI
jgi:hypothetical protein